MSDGGALPEIMCLFANWGYSTGSQFSAATGLLCMAFLLQLRSCRMRVV